MKGSITAVSAAVLCSLLASCADPVPPTEALRPVKTVELKYNGEHDSHRYFAVVSPRNEVEQAFRVGGKVLERRVNIGQKVKKGDVLASLDDSDYKLAAEAAAQRLTAAQARAQQAESDWQRLQALKRDGSVSASQEEQARSNLSTAKATAEAEVRQLVLARNQVKYAVLTAPLSGVVTSLNLESGQVVAAGQPVIAIANEAEPEIVVNVPENHLETFKNSRYQASLARDPDQLFDVTLRELSAQAAAQTRTFRARLKPEAGRKLSLGASATLITKSKGNDIPVAVIPATALTQNQGKPAVWAVQRVSNNEGAVELVNVSIHSYRNDDVLVYGPAAGTLVVTAGVQKMTAGLPVSLPVTAKTAVASDEVAP